MNLQVGVKVLLKNNEGRYLLLHRNVPLADGSGMKWDIPGGRIKEGESLQDALQREIREETGLTLTTTSELLAAQDIFIPNTNTHVIRLTYQASIDGPATLSDEHQDYRWVAIAEARELEIDPYLREVLEHL